MLKNVLRVAAACGIAVAPALAQAPSTPPAPSAPPVTTEQPPATDNAPAAPAAPTAPATPGTAPATPARGGMKVGQTGNPDPGVNFLNVVENAHVRVLQVTLQPGAIRRPHVHNDVTFHVLVPITGSLELTVDKDPVVTTVPGQAYYMMRGQTHSFTNKTSAPVQVIELFIKPDPGTPVPAAAGTTAAPPAAGTATAPAPTGTPAAPPATGTTPAPEPPK